MSAQGEPDPVDPSSDPQADRLRWLARGVVLAIGLWFVADGLSGLWPAAGVAARVVIVVGAVLVVALLVLGLMHLARRGREG